MVASRSILFIMAVTGGLTVANLYYNQPLLEAMRQSLGCTELQANLITFTTQLGYATGLILVVPLADMVSRRKIITTNMCVAVVCCLPSQLSSWQCVWFACCERCPTCRVVSRAVTAS